MIYIKMAWRNLWRNKRRTLITITSILFAMFFALVMRSMQKGSYANMVDNVVGTYSGYIQIHAADYWDKKTIEESLDANQFPEEEIGKLADVKGLVPRLESFALASSENVTKGILLTGIIPEKEDVFTGLSDKIVDGNYLESGDGKVMLAEKLAGYLKLRLGDTLVLISTGYHGVSAAGKYAVKGILHFPSPELNKQLVFMNLNDCQAFFGTANRLTSYVVLLDKHSPKIIAQTQDALKAKLSESYEVMSWQEMMPDLVQLIESDNASGKIMLGILYMIIAFGIMGTIMMMTIERMREFGVMVALGMQKFKLGWVVWLETLLMGFMGIVLGSVLSMPVIYHYYLNPIRLTGDAAASIETFGVEPIMPFAWESSFYFNQALVVLVITLITALYPFFKVIKLEPVTALKQK
ncbi:ABC-type lipoprotein release transport system permease subunit [Ancylomarina subtilis]|uniref:ABC-type lipoprotein release transport system permease subunit n=1 Tax=Ancylomarina subtilis TaxID=1639035 RepID=A0A4Q7VJS9_9BACT|nr:FtsX-like permease family protein [Ancylomarina subtilis]RZT96364.1 ABC-type lipoprotein release transport system permease subunit [Ancylomarina subtilis]